MQTLGLAAAIAVLLALPPTTFAQYPPDLDAGQAIRVMTAGDEDWRGGEFLYGEIGRIHVRLKDATSVDILALSDIDSLEVWASDSAPGRHVRTGALVGAAVGLTVGFIASRKADENAEGDLVRIRAGSLFTPLLTLIGLGAGAGIGSMVGGVAGWSPVELDRSSGERSQLRLVPDLEHRGVALTFAF